MVIYVTYIGSISFLFSFKQNNLVYFYPTCYLNCSFSSSEDNRNNCLINHESLKYSTQIITQISRMYLNINLLNILCQQITFLHKVYKPFIQLSVSNAKQPFIHLHFPWKQCENGCIHCSVNSHKSFNSRFPKIK